MEKIALQLYSIKELTQTDFIGTIKKVAKIGYNGVEFAGYFNTSSSELRKALDSFGLKAAGSHVGIESLRMDLDAQLEYSLEIGNPYLICPYIPPKMRDSLDSYKRTAELFNKIGQSCRTMGISFGYHNHDFEFQKYDGKFGLDLLVSNTEPENLFIELDTFWVEFTGNQSLDFIEKYKNRCSILHIKDMKSLEEKINTEIGNGVMDFPPIVAAGKKWGTEWFTVEQEEFEIPQLQSIEKSLLYLKDIL